MKNNIINNLNFYTYKNTYVTKKINEFLKCEGKDLRFSWLGFEKTGYGNYRLFVEINYVIVEVHSNDSILIDGFRNEENPRLSDQTSIKMLKLLIKEYNK